MPRQARYYLSDVTQHVIQRGNNRQPTFLHDTDYLVYLECLKQAMFTHACDVHAYVLMPNHVLRYTGRCRNPRCRIMSNASLAEASSLTISTSACITSLTCITPP